MKRQLEEELDVEKNIGINPKDLDPNELLKPREDDTHSPLHENENKDEDENDVGAKSE
jgi:hypothetical protein